VTRVGLLLCLLCCGACPSAGRANKATPVADALLAAAQAFGDDSKIDKAFVRAELERIAGEVRRALASDSQESRRGALNQTIFGKLGFVREVADQDLSFVFLPRVLKQHRGSCVGLGSLYLALGEQLGWSIHGVMVPGHFFVRMKERDGTMHNVELLRRGEEMPDDWYKGRFPIPGGAAREYGHSLSSDEVLGVIEYDVGNERRRQQRFSDARRAYQRARDHFPDFAEAHASLGALAQLLGSLDEARVDYEAARRANPNLPGLDRNLSLLDSERQAHARE
jgi:regulator of sirC expression with transglutaminase-like and TPR domain